MLKNTKFVSIKYKGFDNFLWSAKLSQKPSLTASYKVGFWINFLESNLKWQKVSSYYNLVNREM